jgi:hypothetical protein
LNQITSASDAAFPTDTHAEPFQAHIEFIVVVSQACAQIIKFVTANNDFLTQRQLSLFTKGAR